jgi:hypothetical protein
LSGLAVEDKPLIICSTDIYDALVVLINPSYRENEPSALNVAILLTNNGFFYTEIPQLAPTNLISNSTYNLFTGNATNEQSVSIAIFDSQICREKNSEVICAILDSDSVEACKAT